MSVSSMKWIQIVFKFFGIMLISTHSWKFQMSTSYVRVSPSLLLVSHTAGCSSSRWYRLCWKYYPWWQEVTVFLEITFKLPQHFDVCGNNYNQFVHDGYTATGKYLPFERNVRKEIGSTLRTTKFHQATFPYRSLSSTWPDIEERGNQLYPPDFTLSQNLPMFFMNLQELCVKYSLPPLLRPHKRSVTL